MPTNYLKARMRHWLHEQSNLQISQILDIEMEPSPDGVHYGQTTWYSYDNQVLPYAGPESLPGQIARVLPDGISVHVRGLTACHVVHARGKGNIKNKVIGDAGG